MLRGSTVPILFGLPTPFSDVTADDLFFLKPLGFPKQDDCTPERKRQNVTIGHKPLTQRTLIIQVMLTIDHFPQVILCQLPNASNRLLNIGKTNVPSVSFANLELNVPV
jgi:hypothetical protein